MLLEDKVVEEVTRPESDLMTEGDLPKVALVATEAYKYVRLREKDSQ